MKKINIFILSAACFLTLAACGGNQNSSASHDTSEQSTSSGGENISSESGASSYNGNYKVTIVPVGSTTIKSSKTVQLRTSVSGTTEKDVTWESLNPTLATVSEKGLVTGLSEGTATIKASLNIEPRCFATISITVEGEVKPETLTIDGSAGGLAWVEDELDLTVTVTPAEASSLVTWSSSDNAVATVSDSGHVTFIKEGSVTISAVSKADPSKGYALDYTVKYGTFSSMSDADFDLSKQADTTDAKVTIGSDAGGFNGLYFAHYKGQKYYTEATIVGATTSNSWAWQGLGLGSGLSDTDTRFFTFSPATPSAGNNYCHCIVRDNPNSWGALTDRSQIWGENGLNDLHIDREEGLKFGFLRDGNSYYYLINDKVYYYDYTTKYDQINTIPMVVAFDMSATISKYKLVTAESEVDAILSTAPLQESFYPSHDDVTYNSDADFKFSATTRTSKDNKVKSIGDKAKLVGNFDLEFDVDNIITNDSHTAATSFSGVNIGLSRYDSANINESVFIGRSHQQEDHTGVKARLQSWAYTTSPDDATGWRYWSESSVNVKADLATSSHIKLTRTVDLASGNSNFSLLVDGKEVAFDLGSASTTIDYTGTYLIYVGGEYAGAHISNFVYSSKI